MTVQTETSRSGPYAGAGTTGPFTVGFRFLSSSHLRVIRTSVSGIDATLVLDTDYTASGVGASSGTVTLITALATGEKLTIIRDVPFTQTADYVAGDSFPAESHEDALDLLTMQTQQLSELTDRTLTFPATVTGVSASLPTPSGLKVLGWNAAGTALENLDANTIASIVAYGTAASDLFDGDGVTTAFALSGNPASINNLDVSIGGVAQRPGIDYSWVSGTTVTFTSAPASGTDNILVRYMQALAMGSGVASDIQYTPSGVGASTTTVQSKLRESVSVKDFGAKGDGVTDDTSALTAALADASGKALYVPSGTYILNGGLSLAANTALYGDGVSTVLKRKNSATLTSFLTVGSNSWVKDLFIDGNAASQTMEAVAIFGDRVQRAVVTNVVVYDNYGIGIGWQDSEACVCERARVDGCKASRAGFWNDTYSVTSFYGNGKHRYVECEAINNQLDGINVATPKNVILGGTWSNNGYGGSYGGALGGAGIFTLDGETQDGLTVIGAVCENNSEYGINVGASGCVIQSNTCNNNQLAGIFLKSGSNIIVDGNVCSNNGWYSGSSNPTLWQRAGIHFYTDVSYSTITNNNCYDIRGGSAKQEYGIRFADASGATISTAMTVGGNTTRYNKIAGDNINPSLFSYATLLDLDYDDYTRGENPAIASTSATPSVRGGVRIIHATGPVTVTNILNGAETQIVTVFVVSGIVTVSDNANINLVGAGNLALVNYMSSVTLAYRGGAWWETGRSVF